MYKNIHNFDTKGFEFDTAEGPFKPNWQSIGNNYKCPEWFRDVKFGIYMHWNLNSVSGFNGHYARFMYHQHEPKAYREFLEWKKDPSRPYKYNKTRHNPSGYVEGSESVYEYHVKHFGHPSEFGYKDFAPLWKAEKFDANALAAFYKKCGAKYIGVMAVHCDNFDLFDSTYQPWNSVNMGPQIDVVAAWKEACEKHDLRFAITSHMSNQGHEHVFYQGETDTTGPLAGVPYDTLDPKNDGLYGKRTEDRIYRLTPEFAQSWYLRTKELIDKYDPDLLYFDGGLPNGDYGLNIASHYYNQNIKRNGKQDGVINIKNGQGIPVLGFTVDVESAGINELQARPWQVDTTINPGWFYLGGDMSVMKNAGDAGMSEDDDDKANHPQSGSNQLRLTAGKIIDNLVDIVSKNGNMLLNVGLHADGSIPEIYIPELEQVGEWLEVNGEAIYETRPFITHGEGPSQIDTGGGYNDHKNSFTSEDIRFTTKPNTLYATFLEWPGNGVAATVHTLTKEKLSNIQSVTMLATGEALNWSQDDAGVKVTLPQTAPGQFAYTIKITHK